jgi:hypothetical protein
MARSFRQRFDEAQGRVARLNRGDVPGRPLEGPGSEARLKRVRKKFRDYFSRLDGRRRKPVDRAWLGMTIWLTAWAVCAGVAAAIVIEAAGDRPPMEGLQHVAAYPNCAFARAVGAAPSSVGDPGYWPQHDRDGDGWACESTPDWVER